MKVSRHIILAVALLASCGRHNDAGSFLSYDPVEAAKRIKVYLSQLSGASSRTLAASTDQLTTTASYCLFDNDACVAGSTMPMTSAGKTAEGKSIFASADFPSAPKGVYQITIGSDIRRIDFGGLGLTYKSVFMSGYHMDKNENNVIVPFVAWDNGRKDLSAALINRGFAKTNMKHLTKNSQEISQGTADSEASLANLNSSFDQLKIADNEACFLFMTSHGASGTGFVFEGGGVIGPAEFNTILTQKCGSRPTVAIVSACYAGLLLTDQVKTANRIIFTAASADRSSNGCDASEKYTWFDGCMIESLADANVKTWQDLGNKTKACINAKEDANNASDPQFYYGSSVQSLAINGSGSSVQPITPVPNPSIVPQTQNNISYNASLLNGQESTTLKALGDGKKYLILDFSASWCGNCTQNATTILPKLLPSIENNPNCKFATLVDGGDLGTWNGLVPAKVQSHSYGVTGVSIAGLASQMGVSTSLPTTLLLNVATGKVETGFTFSGADENGLRTMLAQCN